MASQQQAGSGAASGASMGAAFGPWGMAIGAVAGGVLGAIGSSDAEKRARRIAKMQRDIAETTHRENMRILRRQRSELFGQSRAAVIAGNIAFDDTAERFARAQDDILTREIAVEDNLFRQRQKLIEMGVDAQQRRLRYEGYSSLISGATQAAKVLS